MIDGFRIAPYLMIPYITLSCVANLKNIKTQITFKSYENGGCVQLPEGTGYSPYFRVVGSEELLAVRFIDFPSDAEFEKPCKVNIQLLYYPKFEYGTLTVGAKFEVVEGPKVIALGSVLTRF